MTTFSYYVKLKYKSMEVDLIATTKPTALKLEDFIRKYQFNIVKSLPNNSLSQKEYYYNVLDQCVSLLEELTGCHPTQLLTDVKLENGTIEVVECYMF